MKGTKWRIKRESWAKGIIGKMEDQGHQGQKRITDEMENHRRNEGNRGIIGEIEDTENTEESKAKWEYGGIKESWVNWRNHGQNGRYGDIIES